MSRGGILITRFLVLHNLCLASIEASSVWLIGVVRVVTPQLRVQSTLSRGAFAWMGTPQDPP